MYIYIYPYIYIDISIYIYIYISRFAYLVCVATTPQLVCVIVWFGLSRSGFVIIHFPLGLDVDSSCRVCSCIHSCACDCRDSSTETTLYMLVPRLLQARVYQFDTAPMFVLLGITCKLKQKHGV